MAAGGARSGRLDLTRAALLLLVLLGAFSAVYLWLTRSREGDA